MNLQSHFVNSFWNFQIQTFEFQNTNIFHIFYIDLLNPKRHWAQTQSRTSKNQIMCGHASAVQTSKLTKNRQVPMDFINNHKMIPDRPSGSVEQLKNWETRSCAGVLDQTRLCISTFSSQWHSPYGHNSTNIHLLSPNNWNFNLWQRNERVTWTGKWDHQRISQFTMKKSRSLCIEAVWAWKQLLNE
jgi:hypothetical protein